MSNHGLSADALQRAVAALPAGAAATAREPGLRAFLERGAPTKRDEDWKYTDLGLVLEIGERWLQSGQRADALAGHIEIDRIVASLDAHWIVIRNGQVSDYSATKWPDGILVQSLDAETAQRDMEYPLADLNAALLHEGVAVRVEADVAADKPIAFLIADSAADSPVASQVRIAIDVADNCAARFVEYHTSDGDAEHWSNAVVNLRIGDNARADYQRLQMRSVGHAQTEQLNVTVGAGGQFHHHGVDIGGKLVRNDLRIRLSAPGASARFDGLYIVGDGQHVDNHTRVDHEVGPANSFQEYRGILNGHCRGIWNGKAIVHAGADGTDAQQANHNLLLSDHAEIDAKPELEIYADDVKCSHGTTVGQLDERALYYLQTRGIDRTRARRILTRAFAASVVDKSPLTEYREFIAELVEQRLVELGAGARL